MITHRSFIKRSILLRWLVALIALVCIMGAIVLSLAKAIKHVQRDVHRMRIESHLKGLGFAMGNYVEYQGGLPPAAVLDRGGKPLLSWRVLLLPYLEEQGLYLEFKLDDPWDSEHNRRLIPRMPRIYEPYSDSKPHSDHDFPPYMTFFQVIRGPGTPFERPRLKFHEITGVSVQMFLIVEAAEPVIWTKPDDIDYHPSGPLPRLGGVMRDGSFRAVTINGAVITTSLSDEDAIRDGISGIER